MSVVNKEFVGKMGKCIEAMIEKMTREVNDWSLANLGVDVHEF